MKISFDRLKEATATTLSAAGKAGTAIRDTGQELGAQALNLLEQEHAQAAMRQVRSISETALAETSRLTGQVIDKVKEVDLSHKAVADKAEAVSMGLGITSGVAVAGAAIAAPTGLSAVGVALGITSAPLIVTAAPVLGAAATAAGVISGGAYFYSRWRSAQEEAEAQDEAQDAGRDSAGA
ncbi:hypothetical protein X805_39980 [Sphaerotilus natans subsp. natans DSM 6575]|jgi:hypothetical protein|uniref:Uncharacterized protein n=1 Tax=Sphaerotilus natans subsp. natans DSM 6575 TaxID=1286631 RepID=A0A059KG13_9BURK|nr:hypothetical protein [Sphaerotilus natans]KDB50412.1 hypothetical protein X805_39980 [Sphaerotilus natans subsp. natans DSM 6575]SIR80590.1 hypothetical protein SAMN05421778_11787 [Sphaerotilus natans]